MKGETGSRGGQGAQPDLMEQELGHVPEGRPSQEGRRLWFRAVGSTARNLVNIQQAAGMQELVLGKAPWRFRPGQVTWGSVESGCPPPLFFSMVDALAAHDHGLAGQAPSWPKPKGIVKVALCPESGQLPGPHCPHKQQSWFIAGRSPNSVCDIHRAFDIDASTGRRVCASRPHGAIRQEVFEVWPTDMLKLWSSAGLPRKVPPVAAPGCEAEQSVPGLPPRITSPLHGVAYTLRPGKGHDTLALLAETDGDAREVFWYVGTRFAGKSASGRPWLWKMEPGTFVLRAVDDRGRSDAQTLRVEVSP